MTARYACLLTSVLHYVPKYPIWTSNRFSLCDVPMISSWLSFLGFRAQRRLGNLDSNGCPRRDSLLRKEEVERKCTERMLITFSLKVIQLKWKNERRTTSSTRIVAGTNRMRSSSRRTHNNSRNDEVVAEMEALQRLRTLRERSTAATILLPSL